ncbi:MAG: hypothetical protein M3Z37_06635 [Candidatus Eremiobacteraeota bacterium]|nr:hypothetical protein [Candidatus Eremiobacteraeota bacterium]
MACSAKLRPQDTPLDRALYVRDHLAPNLFRSIIGADTAAPAAGTPTAATPSAAWRLSPQPFALSPATVASLQSLGADLLKFYRAVNRIYSMSVRGTAPEFFARYLELGKPEHIVRLQRQNRFRSDVPSLIRPDIILTEDGMIASELDSIPGGMGFVGAMGQTYCELGFDQVGEFDGMVRGFARMAQSLSGKDQPTIAIVVSAESDDYRGEMSWLADALRAAGLAEAVALRPEDVFFTEEALVIDTPDGRRTVDVLYRNFELFDLLNVSKQELMMYAARHKRVVMTPPPKSFLEEKLAFALLHNNALHTLWRQELGAQTFERLLKLMPQTWILDPRPLPPQAVLAGLSVDGYPVRDWRELYGLSKAERQFVVKPSGFSPLAWGSKGVYIANDLTRNEWMAVLDGGLATFESSPQILQRYHKARRVRAQYVDVASNTVKDMDGRVRLCPYYFVAADEAILSGVLATVVPADKRLIHGMADAIMAPCMEAVEGY